jgi:hypothetical protein
MRSELSNINTKFIIKLRAKLVHNFAKSEVETIKALVWFVV